MGCGSPSVKTGIFPGEDEFKQTGDSKKDFFIASMMKKSN